MAKDGKRLEGLVAHVESVLVPEGFTVATNTDVRDDSGLVIAEFDIEVRGLLSTTDIVWLIECRDRPSAGPAPASWIEQLIGRRTRFNLNRVTAVSTTGFTKPAIELAKAHGIELRAVKALTPEDFSDWLQIRYLTLRKPRLHFSENGTKLIPIPGESEELIEALKEALIGVKTDVPLLVPPKSEAAISVAAAIDAAIRNNPTCVDHIGPNEPARPVKFRIRFNEADGYYTVKTKLGPVRIGELVYFGGYSFTESKVPLAETSEYSRLESEKPLSQLATFDFELNSRPLSVEIVRIEKTGEMHVLLRAVGPAKTTEID